MLFDLPHVISDAPRTLARHGVEDRAECAGGHFLESVPPGYAPHMAKISDLNMLTMMGGQERGETEWRELLTAAGFAGIEIRQTSTPFSVT